MEEIIGKLDFIKNTTPAPQNIILRELEDKSQSREKYCKRYI